MTQQSQDQHYVVPPPVTYSPELLPLGDPNLPWEQFEAFCEGLISRLPDVKETHRYGRRGSNQRGIDIFADFENGERWAFQCRQWKRFTKTDATRAIQNTSYPADRFILMLSLGATTGVRDACNDHASWDVWDLGDISRRVHQLSMHSAVRLVETHFGPAWRKEFLGLHGLASLVTPDEFFRPLLNESDLFNHGWQLVGRSDHVRQAHNFVKSPQQKVGVLVGRGGIGKSKMLHAFAETFDAEHEGLSLWFAAEGMPFAQELADDLPFVPCVVVVDDAHRRADLPVLLALSLQRSHLTKIILSCRPQGVEHLRSQLIRAGFDIEDILDLPDVKELSREEVTELGRQALGTEFAELAEKLAAATWDCPLVTVVGGQLLARKAITPDLLERDRDFRHVVLSRFQDILMGKIGDQIDVSLCKSMLDLIAAVQPIRLDNEQTLDAEADFLDISRPGFRRNIDILEVSGVLLRRGYTLRIVPDVLADHILHNANLTSQGTTTGYADLIFDEFASLCPSEVLRNLSELDWRQRSSSTQTPDLLGNVWRKIEQEFREAPHSGRLQILQLLRHVAVYQPAKILELVEFAFRNPATQPEDPDLSKTDLFTHSTVLHELPALLRGICYNVDFIPYCCNLLWELGKDDDRELNPRPDHPMRVLADVGGYDVGKPFVVNQKVLDVMENLLKTLGIHEHAHSPLGILDPMLSKTGFSAYSEGHKFVYRPFTLKKEAVEAIRQRAIGLIAACLSSDSPRVTLRALKSLENALLEPIGMFNQDISDEDREQWRSEQLEILAHIECLTNRSVEPVVHFHIKKVLFWHRNYNPSDEIRRKADAISSSIPESFDFRLTSELIAPYHSDDWVPNDDLKDHGYKQHQEQVEIKQRDVVSEFLKLYGEDAVTAYRILAERIQTINDAGIQSEPRVVLGILGNSDPSFAAALCDIIVGDPVGTLSPYLQSLLSNVRTWDPERARTIAHCALKEGANVLCSGVALSYQSRGCADNSTERDVENISELLSHEDEGVRWAAIGAIGMLAEVHEREAIELARDVKIGDSDLLAEALCRLFYGGWGIPFEELTPDDIRAILTKLEDVNQVENYIINIFLVRASEIDARAVVRLLLNRIMKDSGNYHHYYALPLLGFNKPLTGLAGSPDQESILREVRDAFLSANPAFRYWIPELFREISLGFKSLSALNVLNEWINSGCPDNIESAAHLLLRAHPGFVFENVEFVSNLLERAHLARDETSTIVGSYLTGSAISGTRAGTAGEPLPQDVALRDKALAVAGQFALGSPQNRFYDSLAKGAEATIRDQMLRDEEMSW